jgi:uncharacterized protein (DUF362 family)
MSLRVSPGKRGFLLCSLVAMGAAQLPSCGSGSDTGSPAVGDSGGSRAVSNAGDRAAAGGGGNVSPAGATSGGAAAGGSAGTAGAAGEGGSEQEVVAICQSETDSWSLTTDQIRALVIEAVDLAGGLDFITDGQTVVLKPNLVTRTTANAMGFPIALEAEVNAVTTDWRVSLAVAELVRARNPSGQILVMEGSATDTEDAFEQFGYTSSNFGSNVDEFIPLEGSSCMNPSTDQLVEAPAVNGQDYWVDKRYLNADVLISLPTLKTHYQAGITGAVKNLGIGATPAGAYGADGCTRMYTRNDAAVDPINHEREPLAQWIHDYYSVRPADFAVMDGLRGLAHGPEPSYVPGGDYETDRKNMRLILAARNAVAMDTIEALVMGCDPAQIGYLTLLDASSLGPADPAQITVVGKRLDEVSLTLEGPDWACSLPLE